jgi:hypothetical protein
MGSRKLRSRDADPASTLEIMRSRRGYSEFPGPRCHKTQDGKTHFLGNFPDILSSTRDTDTASARPRHILSELPLQRLEAST